MSLNLILAHIGHPCINSLHLALRRNDIPMELRNIIVEHYFPFLPNEEVPLTFAQFRELITGNLSICSNYIFDGTFHYLLKCEYNMQLKTIKCQFQHAFRFSQTNLQTRGKCLPTNPCVWSSYTWCIHSYKLSDYHTTEELYYTIMKMYRHCMLNRMYNEKSLK